MIQPSLDFSIEIDLIQASWKADFWTELTSVGMKSDGKAHLQKTVCRIQIAMLPCQFWRKVIVRALGANVECKRIPMNLDKTFLLKRQNANRWPPKARGSHRSDWAGHPN
jgi:methyl coenzyme M reductase subunit C